MPIFKKKAFGGLLKRLRNEHDMTQDELAWELKVSRQTIANTENGSNIPKAAFIEKAYRIFHSCEFIARYVAIQKDKKELLVLAEMLTEDDYSATTHIMKQIIRESLNDRDLHTIFSCLFQVIMWDLKFKGKVNTRKHNLLITITKELDPDPDIFFDLIEKLYHVSRETNNFESFIKITDGIMCKVKLDNRRLSQLLCHQANAYYYSKNIRKAYKASERSIEVMNGEVFKHTAFAYHRHSMICLQKLEFEEALEADLMSLSLLSPKDSLYSTVKAGLARLFYMNDKYEEAWVYWNEAFRNYDANNPERTHSLNDIIFMEIKLGNFDKAKEHIKECERLLCLAKKKNWRFHGVESMLLRRNKVMLEAVQTGNFLSPAVTNISIELENSYLKDEREITKNFIHERLFLSGRM